MSSSESASRLRQVGPDREVPADESNAAMGLLLLSLKTLSQKTLVALSSLFTASAVFSLWWLFDNDVPIDPSVHQLIALGLYGSFILAIHWVKRK